MTAIKRSAQASLLFIHSGALPPAGISQSWTATSCPAFLRVQAIQCALVRSAELKLMKNFCPMEFPEFRLDSIFDSEALWDYTSGARAANGPHLRRARGPSQNCAGS